MCPTTAVRRPRQLEVVPVRGSSVRREHTRVTVACTRPFCIRTGLSSVITQTDASGKPMTAQVRVHTCANALVMGSNVVLARVWHSLCCWVLFFVFLFRIQAYGDGKTPEPDSGEPPRVTGWRRFCCFSCGSSSREDDARAAFLSAVCRPSLWPVSCCGASLDPRVCGWACWPFAGV